MDKRAVRRARWQAHVSGWRGSGQTQGAYCALHGLSVSTLGYWITRLSKETAANGGGELALIPGRLPAVSSLAATGVGLTLRSPTGWVLALDDLPPPAWVRQLLMVEAGR